MVAAGTKICVMHKNVPAIIASVTTVLANAGLNIDNMVNSSKKDFAYTILDVSGNVPTGISDEISKVTGVIRVRIFD